MMPAPVPSSHPRIPMPGKPPCARRLSSGDPVAPLLVRAPCNHPRTKGSTRRRGKQHLGLTHGKMRQTHEGAHARTRAGSPLRACNPTPRASSCSISCPITAPSPSSPSTCGGPSAGVMSSGCLHGRRGRSRESFTVSDSISICPTTCNLEAFHYSPSPLPQRLKNKN